MRSLALFAIWPVWALGFEVLRIRKRTIGLGVVFFSVLAGWTFRPVVGSDAHTYAEQITSALARGEIWTPREPLAALFVSFPQLLGLGPAWYRVVSGAIIGTVFLLSARLVLQMLPRARSVPVLVSIYLAALLLSEPIFAGLNARFYVGLWFIVLGALLVTRDRPFWALVAGACAFGFHFGHVFTASALAAVVLTQRLGGNQLLVAYTLLALAVFAPASAVADVGVWVAGLVGGEFGAQVQAHAALAERYEYGAARPDGGERNWFLGLRFQPALYGLLLSAHLLWLRDRTLLRGPVLQLWCVIVIIWAWAVGSTQPGSEPTLGVGAERGGPLSERGPPLGSAL